MNNYYPFGLTFNSYQRENSVDQEYLYNGKELQDELELDWLDYGDMVMAGEEYAALTGNGLNYFDLKRQTNDFKKEDEERERKGRGAKELLSKPFQELEAGKYVWNGTSWVVQ